MIAADIAIRRIAVVLILIGLPAISGAAVGSASQSSVPVTIQSESVVSEFPSGLRFVVSASLSESVDRADVRFTVGANPTFYESTVRFEPTVDPVLELPISFQILGIPPGVEIAYQWRFHTPAGETFASMTFTTEWVDNRFDWAVFEAEDLLVFAYGTDDDLYRYTAQIAQETVERFQAMLDAPERPEPIRIWLYDTQDDLHGSLSPNSREWIGGVSYADFSLIAGVVPAGGDGTMLRVIPHEIVHQILDDATANPFNYPAAWFDEGIAGFGQPVGTESFQEIVEIAIQENRLPSVQSMIAEWGSEPVLARTSYAASYSVVSYIVDSMGEEALKRLSDAYSEGLSHDEAVIAALGVTVDELDARWRESLLSDSAN